ncbi:hypothetical protein ACFY2T_15645 [Streptomyces sp. NPDC001260]|uniref:hypothetical protein n=1 Tax=Streptomyces sp. NPDC001260 TaxID=3364551 RepID=UPI0036848717
MVRQEVIARRERSAVGWGWFASWLALGACAGVGLAAILTVGIALVLPAAVGAGVLLWKGPRNAAVGLLAGLAVPLFYLAYLNRGGPGNVCHTVAGGQSCTDEYTPVPFLVAGVVLAAAGFLLFVLLSRKSGTSRG